MEIGGNLGETAKASGLADGYDQWKREVNAYTEAKQNFVGKAEPYRKVTNAHVKAQEVQYNPITQVFTDPTRESQVRQIESQNMVDVLAQNKVSLASTFADPVHILIGPCSSLRVNLQHHQLQQQAAGS